MVTLYLNEMVPAHHSPFTVHIIPLSWSLAYNASAVIAVVCLFCLHVTDAQARTPLVGFLCALWEGQTTLAGLQSGFAGDTVSSRASWREAQLPSEGPGSLSVGCLSARGQAGGRLMYPHENERLDWRRGKRRMGEGGGDWKKEVRTGEDNTCTNGGQVWARRLQGLVFPLRLGFLDAWQVTKF